jgi:hypothetical protein
VNFHPAGCSSSARNNNNKQHPRALALAVYILIPRVPGCVQSEMSPPCMHKQLIYSQTLASVMINFAWKAIEEAPKIFTRTAFGCSNLECGEIYSLLIRQCRRPRNNNAAVYLNHATVCDNLNANNGECRKRNYYSWIMSVCERRVGFVVELGS